MISHLFTKSIDLAYFFHYYTGKSIFFSPSIREGRKNYVYFNMTRRYLMKYLKPFFLVTDIGFIIYWIVTYFHLIPTSWAFKDYDNPIIIAWNWSFFPLDILISITGLSSLYLYKKGKEVWKTYALISLVLTFCSGLQAIVFWIYSKEFDLSWWAMNLYLMIYPLFFIRLFIGKKEAHLQDLSQKVKTI